MLTACARPKEEVDSHAHHPTGSQDTSSHSATSATQNSIRVLPPNPVCCPNLRHLAFVLVELGTPGCDSYAGTCGAIAKPSSAVVACGLARLEPQAQRADGRLQQLLRRPLWCG